MKYVTIIIAAFIAVSCGQHQADSKNIIQSNPYLIGNWKGEGRFLDDDLFKEIGNILIEVEITSDFKILARIGEATLINTSICEANCGFEIQGKLDGKVSNSTELEEKDCVVILLVLPEENRENATTSNANFHLKSNFTFDFTMRVGGMVLKKRTTINYQD